MGGRGQGRHAAVSHGWIVVDHAATVPAGPVDVLLMLAIESGDLGRDWSPPALPSLSHT